jgi:glycosyltransferase involved in cell wall biosynthesis
VSVALPVRNARATLALALRSIQRQTFSEWELLVLDDSSSDGSKELALDWAERDPRIRVLDPNGPSGLASRLNQAVKEARGEFIARMDADDVAYPQRLQRQLEYLDADPATNLVGTSMLVFGKHGEARGVRWAPPSHEGICSRPPGSLPLFHPTWFGRSEWFHLHGYRPSARRCEDQEMLFRARRTSRFANLPEPLLGYREDRLRLRSVLMGRASFARTLASSAIRGEGVREAVAAIGGQTAKGLLDLLAVSTRLESQLLQHRARPAPAEAVADWARVWVDANCGGSQPNGPPRPVARPHSLETRGVGCYPPLRGRHGTRN